MISTSCDIVMFILSLSLAGSLSFIILSVGQKFALCHVKMIWISTLLKVVILFFLIPAIIMCLFAIPQVNSVYIHGKDFYEAKFIKINTFSTILNNKISDLPFFNYLIAIWIIGFFLLFIVREIKYKLILNKLIALSYLNKYEYIDTLKSQLQIELKIKKPISIYITEIIGTPFISGIFNTKIFIPRKLINDRYLYNIMKHELIHYKNNDLVFKKLAMLIKSLHWFNPIVSLFIQSFYSYSEMACDEAVLFGKSKNMRKQYAQTIINMLDDNGTSLNDTVGFLNKDVKSIERRLFFIMKVNLKPKKSIMLLLTLLTVCLCPVTVYASAVGVAQIQEKISGATIRNYQQEVYTNDNKYVEQTSPVNINNSYIEFAYATRGANLIDCTLNNTEKLVIDSVSFSAGSKVQFILASTDGSAFRAGVIDSKGNTRYVNSSKGTISYSFDINTSGKYSIYIQGDSSNVHITGSITI